MVDKKELCEKRRKTIIRHIDIVRGFCVTLGDRLIESGEEKIGHFLICNGFKHDASKFEPIEFDYLNDTTKHEHPDKFQDALTLHWSRNPHHPEYWIGGVEEMPRLYLAEFVCDINARASEFGTDIKEWLKHEASKKYHMKPQDKKYREILDLLRMLLEPKFE